MAEPALTAEEWAQNHWPYVYPDFGSSSPQIERAAKHRHAMAALALYGQPYGFTWEDVGSLRGAAVNWPYERPGFFADLADRIAALLPPREEPGG